MRTGQLLRKIARLLALVAAMALSPMRGAMASQGIVVANTSSWQTNGVV